MVSMGIPQGTPNMSIPPRTAVTLYIGDLDEQINEEMLYLKLVQFGQIFTLKIARDFNKKSRGFAFVTFYQKADGNFLSSRKSPTGHEPSSHLVEPSSSYIQEGYQFPLF